MKMSLFLISKPCFEYTQGYTIYSQITNSYEMLRSPLWGLRVRLKVPEFNVVVGNVSKSCSDVSFLKWKLPAGIIAKSRVASENFEKCSILCVWLGQGFWGYMAYKQFLCNAWSSRIWSESQTKGALSTVLMVAMCQNLSLMPPQMLITNWQNC